MITETPEPPYYAVIFTSLLSREDDEDYQATAARMLKLAQQQPGFLGIESARDAVGITVSYWDSLDAIKRWKAHLEHREAQHQGRERWYTAFKVRIARVERDYGL